MPLTFTPRVVRNVSESNLTAHRLSAPIGNRQPPEPHQRHPKKQIGRGYPQLTTTKMVGGTGFEPVTPTVSL